MVKDWNKIGVIIGIFALVITIFTLIIVYYQAFILQPNTDRTLSQIASNTNVPKPNLNGDGKCYIFQPNDTQKYFQINDSNYYYADFFTIRVTNSYASNLWMKILIPNDIQYAHVISMPEGLNTPTEETIGNGKIKGISFSWQSSFPPDRDIKVIVLYSKDYGQFLKSEPRYYNFGSKEMTVFYYLATSCYNADFFNASQ